MKKKINKNLINSVVTAILINFLSAIFTSINFRDILMSFEIDYVLIKFFYFLSIKNLVNLKLFSQTSW